MKNYEWILFDADDTLFHFDAFSGLKRMFARFGVEFMKQDYQQYQALNKSLWVESQQGMITAPELQQQRFNTGV
jgi:5'-nucleotidase